jgi:hypothetical protein
MFTEYARTSCLSTLAIGSHQFLVGLKTSLCIKDFGHNPATGGDQVGGKANGLYLPK